MTRCALLALVTLAATTSAQAATNPLAGLTFTRWTDPQEGAYSLEVPRGWRVQGGTTRPNGGTGALSQTLLSSPDGRISIRMGDVNLPTSFVVPNDSLTSLGYGEGSRPSSSSMVLRYLQASDFAAYYVSQTLGNTCANLARSGARSYPEYVRTLPTLQYLHPSDYSAGDFSFTCRNNAGVLAGYAYAETYATNYQGTGTAWAVVQLRGYTAPPNQANLALGVLSHAIATVRLNPQWYASEFRGQQQVAQMQQQSIGYSASIMNFIYDEHVKATQRAGTEPQKGYEAPYYTPPTNR
ncbi:hypothetical protein [Deinococcus sp.]|uniref:hypothetical protein n=1 Tax=Deinococcus sp. TaxID=47478 RepID=UPI003CC52A3D